METQTIPTISGSNGKLLSMIRETGVEPVSTMLILSMMKEAWKKTTGNDKCSILFVRRDGKCDKMTTIESEAIALRDHCLQYGIKSDIVRVEI